MRNDFNASIRYILVSSSLKVEMQFYLTFSTNESKKSVSLKDLWE